MSPKYLTIDLFAGPGGLAEGFSRVLDGNGQRRFHVGLSAEMDPLALQTLRLRAFTRHFPPGALPSLYYDCLREPKKFSDLQAEFPDEWASAESEALLCELGTKADDAKFGKALAKLLDAHTDMERIVIGGPPCQAYSLIGRARNKGKEGYDPKDDRRHFLYREYIRILELTQPAAFVMENVKGMLSSSVGDQQIFSQVMDDLRRAGGTDDSYVLVPLCPKDNPHLRFGEYADHRDFIVRAEEHGVPQTRHRVFIIGIRSDVFKRIDPLVSRTLMPVHDDLPVTVEEAISSLPKLRSGLSRADSNEAWSEAVVQAIDQVIDALPVHDSDAVTRIVRERLEALRPSKFPALRHSTEYDLPDDVEGGFLEFVTDASLSTLTCHNTRGHMPSDLSRYLFCSTYAEVTGKSPRAVDYPAALAPRHQNWDGGHFVDRFKTQITSEPSKTITSHISKDGHYYIHPDPSQCRSLTVREAARLQTFPDNYYFIGGRTAQYHQVGNAVPPYLAWQIGVVLARILDGSLGSKR